MTEMNFERARQNMIEQQIRPWEVLDQQVLALVKRTPRERYVPEKYRKLAFADMNISLGRGQVMMQPKIEARLLQELDVKPGDTILEIGTGSGYMTALLAGVGKHVYSVEIIPEFKAQAEKKLAEHGVTNITLEIGDGANGWETHAPYDVIMVTGSLPILPDRFGKSLTIGGRLAVIVGKSPVMEAQLIRRLDENSWSTSSLFETDLLPLLNANSPDEFVF